MANKKSIPAIVRYISEQQVWNYQLSENLHRLDLNPIETAKFIESKLEDLKNSGVQNPRKFLSEELGCSESWLSKKLSVLKMSSDVQSLVVDGKIKDYSIVRKIEKLGPKRKREALEKINNGTFVAKEFFGRKRPAKTESTLEDNSSVSLAKRVPEKNKYCLNSFPNNQAYRSNWL